MKKIITLLMLCVAFSLSAQNLHYDVKIPNPQTHYANVSINLSHWNEDTLRIAMPVWTPGSYKIREFEKNIDQVRAESQSGEELTVTKINKNTWQIITKGISKLHIHYPVYCFKISVRRSFINTSHAFISPTSALMYIKDYKNLGGTITYHKPAIFKKISTGLKETAQEDTFEFKDYDQLADSPVEIGNQTTFSFMVGKTKHIVALYGKGNYNIDMLKRDMKKICETETAIFGENPNEKYVFIIHNLTRGSGGIEHKNSVTIGVNRWIYKDNYKGFLEVTAHEYFHLWNVKRIRPAVLGPFNYNKENYTHMLWMMEGVTNYYADITLYRAGLVSKDWFLNKLKERINYIERTPGNKVQTVAAASFDAWIKAYRPNENSVNTTVSYYSKGAIIGFLLDIKIIEHSNGKNNFDDFMKALYEYYKNTGKGFTKAHFKKILESYAGNLDDFYKNYIYGTEQPNYKEVFKAVGIDLGVKKFENIPYLGINVSNRNGQWIVRSVRSNGSAYLGGLNAQDEIIFIYGWRFSKGMLTRIMAEKAVGDTIDFVVSRGKRLQHISFELKAGKYPKFYIQSDKENKLQKKWLSKK